MSVLTTVAMQVVKVARTLSRAAMNSTTDDRDSSTAMTTTMMMTDCVQQQQLHHDEPDHSSVAISPDLRQAIDQLRHVTHADVTGRARHHRRHDTDRLPLRPINLQQQQQLFHRLSLPLQLPQHRDNHLAVRQCSSLTDDVVHLTGTYITTKPRSERNSLRQNQTFDPRFG